MKKERVYLAGKMRGIKHYNFPAFDRYKMLISSMGFEVISPADLDRKIGFNPFDLPESHNWSSNPPKFDLHAAIQRDTDAIQKCDGIALMAGWETSVGASAEHSLAKWYGKKVYCAETMQPLSSEVRIKDPLTGGEKGQKLERFDLIPVEPLEEISRVYGRGAKKYAEKNWEKGYKWSLSFGAMMRHAWKFWRGEEFDEDGNHHLACVAFHAMALIWFSKYRKELDDRSKP